MARLASSGSVALLSALGVLACSSSSKDGGAGGGAGGSGGAGGTPITSYQGTHCDYVVPIAETAEEASLDAPDVGSEPTPRHVHVSWAGPSASSFAVNWSTGLDTKLSAVVFGTDQAAVQAADGPTEGVQVERGYTFQYGSTSPLFPNQSHRVHEAHVCGLTAATTYYYKVGGPGHWSPVYDVATAPEPLSAAPFRFAVSGDSRGDPGTFTALQQMILADGADFQVFTGDAVVVGANQDHWNAFFRGTTGSFGVEEALARIPFMSVNGNHEAFAFNYVAQFAFPPENREEYYSFSYANAFFVLLNDTVADKALLGKQGEYLRAQLGRLDRSKTHWVFAVHHRPLYTCSNHSPVDEQVASWEPIYDELGVDFVLAGHNHCYERSKPLKPGGVEVPLGTGTIHVTAGGAGAPLYGTGTDCPFEAITEKTRGYVSIDVDGKTLRYRALRLDGSEIESLTITK